MWSQPQAGHMTFAAFNGQESAEGRREARDEGTSTVILINKTVM